MQKTENGWGGTLEKNQKYGQSYSPPVKDGGKCDILIQRKKPQGAFQNMTTF